jgi:hypothetical protein
MTTAEVYADKSHVQKTKGYTFIFENLKGRTIKTAFMMPGAACNDVRYLLEHDIIHPGKTHLYAVERDDKGRAVMIETLSAMGWNKKSGNLTVFGCSLFEVSSELPVLDLVSIDLFGSLCLRDADWVAGRLSRFINSATHIAYTGQVLARGNQFLRSMWDIVKVRSPDLIEDFMHAHRLYDGRDADKAEQVGKHLIELKIILHDFDFKMSKVDIYNDAKGTQGAAQSEMFSVRLSNFVYRSNPDAYLSLSRIVAEMSEDTKTLCLQEQTGAPLQLSSSEPVACQDDEETRFKDLCRKHGIKLIYRSRGEGVSIMFPASLSGKASCVAYASLTDAMSEIKLT